MAFDPWSLPACVLVSMLGLCLVNDSIGVPSSAHLFSPNSRSLSDNLLDEKAEEAIRKAFKGPPANLKL